MPIYSRSSSVRKRGGPRNSANTAASRILSAPEIARTGAQYVKTKNFHWHMSGIGCMGRDVYAQMVCTLVVLSSQSRNVRHTLDAFS